ADEDHAAEGWLTEAVRECSRPLLELLERLADDRVPVRLTLSLTATLLAMLEDPLLQRRIGERLERLLLLAEREVRRTAKDAAFRPAATFPRDPLRRPEAQWDGPDRRGVGPAPDRPREA